MSSAASDEETEELVAALSDDTDEDEDEFIQEEEEVEDEDEDEEKEKEEELTENDKEEDEQNRTTSSEQSDDDDDDNDELHIAARAGIRLLEENMHFREEVLRLNEQITHLKDEKLAVQHTLEERDTQVSALTIHLRESILANQSVLSELNKANEELREFALQQQQQQQQSPRGRPSQRLSPRRSSLLSRPLMFEQLDGGAQVQALENVESPTVPLDGSSGESPEATTVENNSSISPFKPTRSSATGAESPTSPRRPSSFADIPTSPRRRPSITRLRELEAKYDDEHQRCNSLRLELNFAQRRVSELKPLQSQLSDTSQELETVTSRLAELEKLLAETQAERVEEQALIQSLRQTVAVYEQLNDPRRRGDSADHGGHMTEALQVGGSKTAETASVAQQLRPNQNEQFERLDRAADMIGGRFNLRDENERLLRQLTTLTDQVLQLQCEPQASLVFSGGEDADESSHEDSTRTTNATSTERRGSSSMAQQRQRYLEQQVAVLQSVLRRFRLEWQHAHDARMSLEDEKATLLLQLDRLQTKLHARTRSSSVGSRTHGSPKRKQSQPPQQQTNDGSRATAKELTLSIGPLGTETRPETNNDNATSSDKLDTTGDRDSDDSDSDSEDDGEDAFERRQWQRTQAICEALLLPSSSSKEEEIENELLCFALLRRLVDSWTTDKPKRMQLYDWLANVIRGTGARRPLHLHELSSEIAMGFQTLLVPILQAKFGIQVHVDKRLRNVIVTDLQLLVQQHEIQDNDVPAGRLQRVYHSLLSVIDGEPSSYAGGSGDEYDDDWLGNSYAVRRASRSLLGK